MKLFVGIPTHSETITTATATTLLALEAALLREGHEMDTMFFSGAMIAEQRNAMVAKFMQGRFDRMLMLDADQGVSVDTLKGMFAFDNPVVGCIYPKRRLAWENVGDYSSAGSLRDIVYRSQVFVGELDLGPGPDIQFKVDRGFAEALYVGTGCLVVRRDCIEAMTAHYPDLSGRGYYVGEYPGVGPEWNYGLFTTGWSDRHQRLLSEDYAFCQRWRDMGGRIFASVAADVVHVGRYNYDGSFLGYLQASQGAGLKRV